MVSFRKSFIVMVLLVIVTGIAMAQVTAPVVTCNTFNQQTARLRQESQTELVPALTFSCLVYNQLANQGTPVTAGTLYDWEVFFPTNAPLTSSTAIIGGLTEPQLTVWIENAQTVTREPVAGVYGPFDSGPPNGVGPANGIYPGTATSGGSVIFPTVNMNPNNDENVAATPDTVYITITGLRVSALMLASNPPNYGGPLTLTVWAKPSQTKNGANQSNPGNVFLPVINGIQQPTLAVGLGYAAPSLSVTETGMFDWRQCFSFTIGGTGINDAQYFQVDFTELYSYAFAPPTDFSQTGEAGWELPPGGGTRLAFTLSPANVGGTPDPNTAFPSYVTVSVPTAIEVLDGNSVVIQAILVLGPNADGSGGSLATSPPLDPDQGDWSADANIVPSAAPGTYYLGPWVSVDTAPADTGSNLVVYEIVAPGPNSLANAVTTTLEVPVQGYLNATPPTPYPVPDDPTANVTITLAGYAPWTAGPVPQIKPLPRFAMPPPFSGTPLLEIDPCTTNLLYPYLVAGEGWDTGLTVANTGLDPFGSFCAFGDAICESTSPAVPGVSGNGNDQPGICNVYFYGSFDRGAPLVTDSTNPPTPIVLGAKGFNGSASGDDPADFIQPGTTAEDLIMAVLALNYPTTDFTKHSWNGYAIASCDFLYAHGYAFTVFHGSLVQGGNLSLGYLALVFDQRGILHPSQKPEKMTF